MARYTGPKHKLARREGVNILGKTSQSLDRRINVTPGLHGKRRGRKLSEYGVQLREKQKLKRIYGILEKQFSKYIKEAQRKKINTEEALIQLLESRLDNMVYRLGFANSRPMARQLVSHRHVNLNGKKINIPSYKVQKDDIITLSPKILTEELKIVIEENKELLPFIERKNFQGKMVKLPEKEEVANPVNYQLVIEFYSR
ncbi:MAG: 30S ribosomal protein S4 [Candidatus Levybacteria bacterium CG10_big_fil_rev_8_21_14_0_10_36_7]|nr:MAG: 30S ribosomal protein S4 [Candidatus Levybacteria bacterium CG10_big_fil_rev_8_21_14_0_10_36_7]